MIFYKVVLLIEIVRTNDDGPPFPANCERSSQHPEERLGMPESASRELSNAPSCVLVR